jgi:hypothetical protein
MASINGPYLAQHGDSSRIDGLVLNYLSCWNGWTIAATVLILLATYDQGKSPAAFGKQHEIYTLF